MGGSTSRVPAISPANEDSRAQKGYRAKVPACLKQSNFSTLLVDKRPCRTENIMERNQSALIQNNLMVRHIHVR